ncbi:hypothetical protein ACN261_13575 [Micromonospora sp. WMMD723]|uniref:hypothetical protein n=1 Tax=Micromonospora sp. WMMD723 TaxID=3403465 RepID=UPI003CF1F268
MTGDGHRLQEHFDAAWGSKSLFGPNADPRWTTMLGQPVRNARFSWERLTIRPSMRPDGQAIGSRDDVDVPAALRLDCGGGPVWFRAGVPQFPSPEGANSR